MERDLDLVRKILLQIERSPHGYVDGVQIEGYSAEEIGYHAHLLLEANLITAVVRKAHGLPSPYAMPTSLTWAGHEFLDVIKKDSIWEKGKNAILKHSEGLAVSVFQEWAKSEILNLLIHS